MAVHLPSCLTMILLFTPLMCSPRSERDACIKVLMAAESLKEPSRRTKLQISVTAPRPLTATNSTMLDSVAKQASGLILRGEVDPAQKTGVSSLGSVAPPAIADHSIAKSKVASTTALQEYPAAKVAAATTLVKALPSQPPKTSTEFESTWRGLGGDHIQEAAYLRLFVPDQLPSIFKSSLTPQVLSALVRTSLTAAVTSITKDGPESSHPPASCPAPTSVGSDVNWGLLLYYLTRVPRFDMTAMCLPSKDKEALRILWDQAEGVLALGLGGMDVDMAGLRKAYRL